MKKSLCLILFVLINIILVFSETEWLVDKSLIGGKQGGTLNLPLSLSPATFNPVLINDSSTWQVISYLFDSLLTTDNSGNVNQPLLAKSFTKKEINGTTEYTFVLRKGIKWSDNVPITSEDVEFSFKNIYFNKELNQNAENMFWISKNTFPKIERIDNQTIKFIYSNKFKKGYQNIGQVCILPKHIFEKVITNQEEFFEIWNGDDVKEIVSSGPFILKEYKRNNKIVLEKNPEYYVMSSDKNKLPYLDKIIFYISSNSEQTKKLFETGEVDMFNASQDNINLLKAQAQSKNWDISEGTTAFSKLFFYLNFLTEDKDKSELFRNSEFRAAISTVIDHSDIINKVYNGYGIRVYGPVNVSSAYFNKDIIKYIQNNYSYSITKAKNYINKIKNTKYIGNKLYYKNKPVSIEIVTNSGNKVREAMTAKIAENMKKIGIDVFIKPIPFSSLLERVDSGDIEAAIIGMTDPGDPDSSSNVWKSNGTLHMWNLSPQSFFWSKKRNYVKFPYETRIDEIFDSLAELTDEKKLKELYFELQNIFVKENFVIFLPVQKPIVVYKNNIHLVKQNSDMPVKIDSLLYHIYGVWKE